MDHQDKLFLATLENILRDEKKDTELGVQFSDEDFRDRYQYQYDTLSQFDEDKMKKFDGHTLFEDQELAAYVKALLIALKSLLEIKEAIVDGNANLGTADLSAAITLNDLKNELAAKYHLA